MASIKKFEDFVSEMDRAEEIEDVVSTEGTPEVKTAEETEAYEACLNKMSEAFAKKINEIKEMKDAVDAEDVE